MNGAISPRPAALVTGARRGIGRAICFALAERGFDIALNDLEGDADAAETLRCIRERGGEAEPFYADIADLAAQDALLAAAGQRFPRLACLVNNAGVGVLARGDLLEVSVESYDRCLDINLRGTFFLTQRFARLLLTTAPAGNYHRSIVTISSVNSQIPSPSRGEYCISKTGLTMMTRLFGLRLAAAGIGVYEVRPGIIATPMTAPVQDRYDAFIAAGNLPVPRWGQPQDVADAVATLATGALPYMVGQAVYVDGGLNLRQF